MHPSRDDAGVTRSAPRIDPRLHAALGRLAREDRSIADVWRRLGTVASELELSRPSYEQVRVLVHEHAQRGLAPSTGEVLLDIALRQRPPEALVDQLAGTLPPKKAK